MYDERLQLVLLIFCCKLIYFGPVTGSGVKSTQKWYSSKSFVTDKKTTWSKVQSTDQKKYLSKSKKVVILKLLK